tara:strand:- start:63 stop:386 length:324 start_codon:yes stop_codon:yes gene_type:complete
MVSSKRVIIINVALVFFSCILLLYLFDVRLPSLGQAVYQLDSTEPSCIASWKGEVNQIENIDLCCREAVKLGCERQNGDLYLCGAPNSANLQLNSKAYTYCSSIIFG